MIPVSTLYDEYIERRKFTEQKKPVEYIVPPPSRGSEQKLTRKATCFSVDSPKDIYKLNYVNLKRFRITDTKDVCHSELKFASQKLPIK